MTDSESDLVGDIWPYGPPRYTDWQQCYDALLSLGFDKGDANVLAAIAGAESTYDLSVVNDTPSTGDYSVGCWQINYYNGLYAGRVAEFGTPKHLAQSDVTTQARAARSLWAGSGFSPWSTYKSGAYKAYLHGNLPAGPPPQHQLQAPAAPTNVGADSWHSQVTTLAGHFTGLANHAGNAAKVLRNISR